ncbi:uncharacterized protein EV154DRAFT_165002 [Mucor mucedo]|uniref:uncharacterized protein n=1 Tax=Mucor mucedo TaxID=29922 RepID=UPI002220CCF4|nr:uncharacterized protein EV154DRAFT_165002 [Mucor mucedo]KAI7893064.1 hypothetical protein EV154DRAFT_165002 [Mucor mucedo]
MRDATDNLHDQPLPDLKYRLTNRSITLEDIREHLFGSVEKFFRNEVDKFLVGTSNIIPRPIDIFCTSRIPKTFLAWTVISSVVDWSKESFKKLRESYTSGSIRPKSEYFDYSFRRNTVLQLLENRMEEFYVRRNPIILPNVTTMEEPKSCLKSNIFINIDISPTQIQTVFTYLDKDRQVGQKQNFECNMQPLNSFIKQSELHQRPILRISNRLKLRLETIFGDYLKLYSNYIGQSMIMETTTKPPDQVSIKEKTESTFNDYIGIKTGKNRPNKIRKLFVSSNPNLFKQLTANIEMDDLFASKDESSGSDSESFTTCHPGYMYFFMITYLHCLNKQIEEKLESNIGSNWRANNIWYAVSIDKTLLDSVFGSIKKLEKAFFASGILVKDDELRKAKFCTRGEEILPAIQHIYQHLEFRLKSYFVVAQIYSKHIQLSLHQVVKLVSPEEDPASIIIQDEIIQIDDVYDTLCKRIMKSIQFNCQVDYCTTHKSEKDTPYDFQSFEIYSDIYRNLKPCVAEIFEKNKLNFDMDFKIQLDVNTKCGCCISIFLRDIIEVSLMSVIESMATDIVASLTNKKLFGNYVPSCIFVFGDPFNLGHGSKIHIAYAMLMQKAIDDGVYIKEKDTKTFVQRESIFQLLETFLAKKKPYMFERFVTGTLCQVSSETYGMRVESYGLKSYARMDSGGIKNQIAEDDPYFVFIQKGKPISTKGFIIQVNSIKAYDAYVDILKLESSTSTVPDMCALLHGHTFGAKFDIPCRSSSKLTIRNWVVECEHISNYLSIKVSRGCMSIEDYVYSSYYETLNIIKPLTLAYI